MQSKTHTHTPHYSPRKMRKTNTSPPQNKQQTKNNQLTKEEEEEESNLVFYAQSTSAVISGRGAEEEEEEEEERRKKKKRKKKEEEEENTTARAHFSCFSKTSTERKDIVQNIMVVSRCLLQRNSKVLFVYSSIQNADRSVTLIKDS